MSGYAENVCLFNPLATLTSRFTQMESAGTSVQMLLAALAAVLAHLTTQPMLQFAAVTDIVLPPTAFAALTAVHVHLTTCPKRQSAAVTGIVFLRTDLFAVMTV